MNTPEAKPPLAGRTGSETPYPSLLPCPFCGQTPEWRLTQTGKLAMILCPAGSPCIGTGLQFFAQPHRIAEATDAWNRRQSPNAPGSATREEPR